MNEIVKCMKCGHTLISGANMIAIFGPGTSIGCLKCGNKYVFGQEQLKANSLGQLELDDKEGMKKD